jgi:hypothetical protein
VLKKEINARGRAFKYCLVDFEKALNDAIHITFPDVVILNDFFHFIQANVKRVTQLGLKSVVKDIVVDLNTLWYKSTKREFDVYCNQFLDKWDKEAAQYSSYFRSTWLERYSPVRWASYARPSDAPSGISILT